MLKQIKRWWDTLGYANYLRVDEDSRRQRIFGLRPLGKRWFWFIVEYCVQTENEKYKLYSYSKDDLFRTFGLCLSKLIWIWFVIDDSKTATRAKGEDFQ